MTLRHSDITPSHHNISYSSSNSPRLIESPSALRARCRAPDTSKAELHRQTIAVIALPHRERQSVLERESADNP
jgi:hypothetical protein